MASKWMHVTDVEEAWRLRQAGLLHFRDTPAMTTSVIFPKHLHVKHFNKSKYVVLVEEDEDNECEQQEQ